MSNLKIKCLLWELVFIRDSLHTLKWYAGDYFRYYNNNLQNIVFILFQSMWIAIINNMLFKLNNILLYVFVSPLISAPLWVCPYSENHFVRKEVSLSDEWIYQVKISCRSTTNSNERNKQKNLILLMMTNEIIFLWITLYLW